MQSEYFTPEKTVKTLRRPNSREVEQRLSETGLALEYLTGFEQPEHDFHSHEFIEMLFVLRGIFQHITTDQTRDEQPGSLTILNYQQYHSLKTIDSPVDLINLYWNPDLYPPPPLPDDLSLRLRELMPQHPVFRHLHNRTRHLTFDPPDRLQSLLLNLHREQSGAQPGHESAIQALFSLLLLEIVRTALMDPGPEAGNWYRDPADTCNPRIERVRMYLDQHYQEPVRLQQLCALSSLQPANLCRRFREHTGMSTGDYLVRQRMAAALQRLRTSGDTVLSICQDSGFPDVSRFNRLFRTLFDCTPTEYRRRWQQEGTGKNRG